MYKPVLPRAKKTDIVRTRTGCKGCRKRRTKCDEQKPACGTCTRLGRPCEPVSPKLQFRHTTPGSIEVPHKRRKHSSSPKADGSSPRVLAYEGHPDSSVHGPRNSTCSACPLDYSRAKRDDLSNPQPILGDGEALRIPETDSRPGLSELALSSDELYLRRTRAPQRMPPTLLPHRDRTQTISFYIDVWRQQCIPGLHLEFFQLEHFRGVPILTDIIVALSACRLSRILPQRKISSVSSVGGLCFRPDAGHESLSHEHYGVVMRTIARWSHQHFDVNPAIGLSVLVLFCYLESSMGNFREFRLHSEGVKRLMQIYSDWVVCRGAGLLAAWVEVEMQNWWRRVYFSTPDFHRTHGCLSLSVQLESVLNTARHRRASVLLVLCESHRLHNVAIVSLWDSHKDTSAASSGYCLPPLTADMSERFGGRLSAEEYGALLTTQSQKLDDWLATSPVSDMPEDWQDIQNNAAEDLMELHIQPLRFGSHASAMNFAYYVTARVMQCTGIPEDPSCTHIDSAYEEVEAWVSVLLRIAAGINWEQCLRLNVYTIGFAGLLLASALRSRRLATGLWIQNWLEERLKGNCFEEGNFPVFQILETVRLVNTERASGWDVFALFQTVDDGGGSGKLGSYHSQMLVSLCIYARCMSTGRMCTYWRTL